MSVFIAAMFILWFIYLSISSATDRDIGICRGLFAISLWVVAFAVGIQIAGGWPQSPKNVKSWINWRFAFAMFLPALVASQAVSWVADQSAPRPARESSAGAIENKLDRTLARVTSSQAALLERATGRWGTIGCPSLDTAEISYAGATQMLSIQFPNAPVSTARVTGFGDNIIFLTQRTPVSGHRVQMVVDIDTLTIIQPGENRQQDVPNTLVSCP